VAKYWQSGADIKPSFWQIKKGFELAADAANLSLPMRRDKLQRHWNIF
jgi:hypothetical protein